MKTLLAVLSMLPTLVFAANLTIGTYNIRNFDYDERYQIRTNKEELSSIIAKTGTDLLAVQEINNTTEFARYIKASFSGYDTILSECGGEHGQKLGFMFNTKKLKLLSFNEDLDLAGAGSQGSCYAGSRPGAIALFEIVETKQKFYAISVHLKSGSEGSSLKKRNKQFEIIGSIVKELQATGIQDFIVAGDMNTTTYNTRGEDYKTLTKLVSSIKATDLSANLKCTAYWWGLSDDGIESPSILDHVLVSPGLIKTQIETELSGHCKAVSCQERAETDLGMSYSNVSDHCPVSAKVQ